METVAQTPSQTQAQERLPLAQRRAAFGCIQDQFALRYQACRFISDRKARAARQRELAEQIARFRAQLWPESLPALSGAMP